MPEHPTDAHFSFTFVFKQALNPVHEISSAVIFFPTFRSLTSEIAEEVAETRFQFRQFDLTGGRKKGDDFTKPQFIVNQQSLKFLQTQNLHIARFI